MFKEIFFFELKYRWKRPATFIYFLILFLFCFMTVVSDDITVGGVTSNASRNSPLLIATMMAVLTGFGIMIISAMMSTPVYRDFDYNSHRFLFTLPMKKWEYLAGRFSGSFVMTLFVYLGAPLGIMLGAIAGTAFGWIEPDKINDFNLMSYLQPMLVFVIPNVLFLGGIFFALATLTRKIVYSYLGNVVILIMYILAMNTIMDMENMKTAAIIDPFGFVSISQITRYWTPNEISHSLLPLNSTLLINRVLWSFAGIVFIAVTFIRFKFSNGLKIRERKLKMSKINSDIHVAYPKANPVFSSLINIRNTLSLGWYEFKNIIKEIPFVAIVLSGLSLIITGAISVGGMYGTDVYPVTYIMLNKFGGAFSLFIIIILTFYGGEVIWRDRANKSFLIFDSLPVKGNVFYLSKLWTMFLIVALLMILMMISGMIYQLGNGYTNFELSLYLKHLFLFEMPYYLMLSVFILFVQILVKNKFLGHFVVVIYYIITGVIPEIGLEHRMWNIFSLPSVVYSDMNGYGHYVMRYAWYAIYWGSFAGLIAVFSYLYWRRGTETKIRNKRKIARLRFNLSVKLLTTAFLIVFLGSGYYIYFNTTVLNKFHTSKQQEQMQVDYEKKYKKFQDYPTPKIEDVKINVDIFPEQRKVDVLGKFIIRNRSERELDSVFVILPDAFKSYTLNFSEGADLVSEDKDCNFNIYKLKKSLKPHDSSSLDFEFIFHEIGFRDQGTNSKFTYNGTFFNSGDVCPRLGYQKDYEISDKKTRKKYELPPRERMAEVDDTCALMNTYLGTDGDWITFEAVVSTSADQIALAPGYLQKEWSENNRKYFHYKMDSKILNFYAFISAKYEIKSENYKGINLEVYYHKGHEYNLDKIFKSMKASLDYFSTNFSPYQHKQLRIIEFPRYASFAQSFPNTIPYSEGIGFIANLEDEDAIDYVYYITAHEIAHQWWAHQVIGGDAKGATVMSEALSQYSALMVMEKEYGKEKMRRFLKYEMDRYLNGRRYESNKELPLYLNENQGYIHYRKGSVVMYALRDYIGEDSLNKALSRYIDSTAFQNPPFTNSIEFLSFIDEAVPDSLDYLIDDMFKTITLYSNKTENAKYSQLADNKYRIDIKIDSHKYRADTSGVESEIDFADFIDIGVLGEDEKPLYLNKHRIKKGENMITVYVNEKPEKAGIDVYNKLIDRDTEDNLVTVEEADA